MEVSVRVVSDLHGQAEKFEQALRLFGEEGLWIINGDVLDRGPDVKGLFERIKSLDYHLNLGNHEWVYLAALTDPDPDSRSMWQGQLFNSDQRRRIENNVLSSYGVNAYMGREATARALRERMGELGHLAMIQQAELYYEDDATLAIHAGLSSWRTMAQNYQSLDAITAMHQAHRYDDEPAELFEFTFSNDYKTPSDLGKVLVTGHTHFRWNEDQRLYYGDRTKPVRAFLGSFLDKGDPLFVYDSLQQAVVAV